MPVEIMELDLAQAQPPAFDAAVKGVNAIVNLAALMDSALPRETVFAVNVQAAAKLATACKKLSKFNRFVQISSSSLYHNPKKLPFEEDDEPSPGNAYGESKLEAEKAMQESGVPFVILRPVVIYGLGFESIFRPIVKAVQKKRLPRMHRNNLNLTKNQEKAKNLSP